MTQVTSGALSQLRKHRSVLERRCKSLVSDLWLSPRRRARSAAPPALLMAAPARAGHAGSMVVIVPKPETHLRFVLTQWLQRGTSSSAAQGSALQMVARMLACYDVDTSRHCMRVAGNVQEVGRALGLPAHQLPSLYWTGMLHDIGKVGVPKRLLHKPGKLTQAEYEIVKQHSVRGAELMMELAPDFASIASGIRSHHERWDGHGYPDGISGRRTPLFGRIVAVVDAFEAMTSSRPYRPALPVHVALAELMVSEWRAVRSAGRRSLHRAPIRRCHQRARSTCR